MRRAPPANHPTPVRRDPRPYQIVVLGGLIVYGTTVLDFGINAAVAAVLLATAQLVQFLATRALGMPRFDPKSALISALSLILLLRTNSLWLAALIATVTIASKFVLRCSRGGNHVGAAPTPPRAGRQERARHSVTSRKRSAARAVAAGHSSTPHKTVGSLGCKRSTGASKHIWNPTNFGLAVGMLVTDAVWVSPGQWGTAAIFAFLLAGLGILVTHRAARSDVTWAFLGAYGTLILGRALWQGDPLTIPLHQLESGGLLIFAFFMISDPKTTPNTRLGRIAFATLVASVASFIQFGLFRPNGLIWALFLCAPAVPLIDTLLPGRRYRWSAVLQAGDANDAARLTTPTPGAEGPGYATSPIRVKRTLEKTTPGAEGPGYATSPIRVKRTLEKTTPGAEGPGYATSPIRVKRTLEKTTPGAEGPGYATSPIRVKRTLEKTTPGAEGPGYATSPIRVKRTLEKTTPGAEGPGYATSPIRVKRTLEKPTPGAEGPGYATSPIRVKRTEVFS